MRYYKIWLSPCYTFELASVTAHSTQHFPSFLALHIHSILDIDQPLSIAFSNMLFSYALLLFLFTTFVAAAPTTMLHKRSEYDITTNKDFLVADGGMWTRDKSVSRLYLIFQYSYVFLTYMTGVGGNIDILYSQHLSHPSQQHSSVDEIKWLIKSHISMYGDKIRDLYVTVVFI